ncbi:MAG: sigma-70 family RNA polymerase sigma factor [Acidobacteriota bacterium]|nr:sigma-70 family RNA polymerase sigma factor [Acidobacteriota bacterium]
MAEADRKLAERVRRGDRRALMKVYRQHRAALLGFLVKMVGDRATAEDVFQEVWMKVLQVATEYEPTRGSLRGWLFRIAANAAVDRMRRDAVRRGEELDAPVEDGGARRIDFVASELPDPERRAASAETGAAIGRALGSLPDRQRSAVLLRHQQGLSYAEISWTLGVPEGTAKTLVHRGVAILRSRLGGRARDDRGVL